MRLPSMMLLCAMPLLTGCQTEQATAADDKAGGTKLLQMINARAQTCWVKSKDRDFRDYRVIPELDTRTGVPRLLIVKRKEAQGLPALVIEARGTPARLSSYGPLADDPLVNRIDADVRRWIAGDKACKNG